MKYTLMVICLVISTLVHSQDTLKRGTTTGRGDKGHGDSYFAGTGTTMDSLDNRKLLYKGLVKDTCVETGRIVLTVQVDRKGTVVSAVIGRGTTTSSKCLMEAAKAAALLSKFAKDDNAPELQAGRMSFYFKRK